MNELLSYFLFQYHYCPLPGIGSLQLKTQHAVVIQGEKLITAPRPKIIFDQQELTAVKLERYLAAEQDIPESVAAEQLKSFCKQIANIRDDERVHLPETGSFFLDASKTLQFSAEDTDDSMYPPVHAERIIRQNNTHQILVGDKETTNEVMSEFYTESAVAKRKRWWIASIVLLAAGIAVIVFYLLTNQGHFPGNAMPLQPNNQPQTYEKH